MLYNTATVLCTYLNVKCHSEYLFIWVLVVTFVLSTSSCIEVVQFEPVSTVIISHCSVCHITVRWHHSIILGLVQLEAGMKVRELTYLKPKTFKSPEKLQSIPHFSLVIAESWRCEIAISHCHINGPWTNDTYLQLTLVDRPSYSERVLAAGGSGSLALLTSTIKLPSWKFKVNN